MGLKVAIKPTVSPVPLAAMKEYLRVLHAHEDTVIQDLIDQATSHIDGPDGWLQRAIMTQTWDLHWDEWPTLGPIKIPLPPLQSVQMIEYFDDTSNWITIPDTEYEVDTSSTSEGWVVPGPDGWPTNLFDSINVVHVRFVCGYGNNPSDVPPAIRGAIQFIVANAYAERESIHIGHITSNDERVQGALSLYRILTC